MWVVNPADSASRIVFHSTVDIPVAMDVLGVVAIALCHDTPGMLTHHRDEWVVHEVIQDHKAVFLYNR